MFLATAVTPKAANALNLPGNPLVKKLTSICRSTEEILANDVPIAVEAKELQTNKVSKE